MIASLGMYDHPAFQGAVDRFWGLIRDALTEDGMTAPDHLTRGEEAYWNAWTSPALVLSQSCGLPYRAKLHGKVQLIGTPDYGVEGCPPGYYRSVFLARRDDERDSVAAFSGAAFAYNEPLSQSGWAAAETYFRNHSLKLTPVMQTGSHRTSIMAIAEGKVDFAAIDAVTWSLLQEHEQATQMLRVVGLTDPTPGLPYIAAVGRDAEKTRSAVIKAVRTLAEEDRTALRLRGFVHIPASAYLAQPIPAAPNQNAQSF